MALLCHCWGTFLHRKITPEYKPQIARHQIFWAATKLFTRLKSMLHDLCCTLRILKLSKPFVSVSTTSCVGIPGLHRLLADLRENSCFWAMDKWCRNGPCGRPLGPVPGVPQGASCVEFSHGGVVQGIGHPTCDTSTATIRPQAAAATHNVDVGLDLKMLG